MSDLSNSWLDKKIKTDPPSQVPAYLEETYWWAYVHPNAVAFFERQWLINLILWGNYRRLRDAVLDELGEGIQGSTLQVACAYGDFSVKLAERIAKVGSLDIVDVLPIQLNNLQRKLPLHASVRIIQGDSAKLKFANARYDQAILFFLLHEQPGTIRSKTLSEALRVLKPGGKLVIVDYHKPAFFHPLRYLFPPVLRLLEPFALDLWQREIESWLPKNFAPRQFSKQTLFGGLYQKVVICV
ncbi:MAG TPA: rhodoquinone biosynthesis methyltransferase RquA [Anaerolineales bacterium]|jgi:ubiquinone/menaquinone biosynthesis C-methylase UbiE|nr:rhodoquinone biosynthesis methyltransferase RquA [Anaerolineales bacterium]